jgi:chromosome segregation ATPase
VPSSLEIVDLGDEPVQLHRLADAIEAWIQGVQEEKEQAIESLKKEKEDILEQLQFAWYCVTVYENERDEFWAMLEGDKAHIQKEKDQLLAEHTAVKEVMRKSLRSMPGLAQDEDESIEVQVTKLAKAIQQIQTSVTKLELQVVPSTSQEMCDQREEATKRAVERIKILT